MPKVVEMDSVPESKKEVVRRVGKTLVEGMKNHPRNKVQEKWKKVSEAIQAKKEALGDESELYSTAMAQFIEEAYKPKLLANDVINELALDMSGYDSIKIPKDKLLTAVSVNDDGSFPSEETTSWGSESISVSYIGAYTAIPQRMLDVAAVDLLATRLGQIGEAISRKVDTGILGEFSSATTPTDSHYGDNTNYNYLGSSNNVSWSDFIETIQAARENYSQPDTIITNPGTWARLHKDADFKDALAFSTVAQGEGATIAQVQQFGEMKILTSNQVSANTTYFVDSDNCGYLIDATPIKNFDGRVSNTVQQEVVGLKGYGIRVVRPESVTKMKEDTDKPT